MVNGIMHVGGISLMEYTDKEKQILELLERTDFRNLSKNDLISFDSKLNEMCPGVATQVIAQFPELTSMIKSSLVEYKGMLDTVVASDDESVKQAYTTFDKEIDEAATSRKEYINLADKVRADLSKCLDHPNLNLEERRDIIEREMDILRMVDQKDSEIRDKEMEVVHLADKKDFEKRSFNWKLISGVGFVVFIAVGIGSAALGGNFNFKLPKKS